MKNDKILFGSTYSNEKSTNIWRGGVVIELYQICEGCVQVQSVSWLGGGIHSRGCVPFFLPLGYLKTFSDHADACEMKSKFRILLL